MLQCVINVLARVPCQRVDPPVPHPPAHRTSRIKAGCGRAGRVVLGVVLHFKAEGMRGRGTDLYNVVAGRSGPA